MKPEDIIKATCNSLNIYAFTAEALEKLIAAIQSEHKCQTCEALARTVMMDQTAHDTHNASQRQWIGLTDDEIKEIVGPYGDAPIKGYTRKLFDQIEAALRSKNT